MRAGRVVSAALAVVVLGGACSTVWADGEDPMSDAPPDVPSLSCTVESLPTRGFELSVARLTCQVVRAPAADAQFSASLVRPDDPSAIAQPLCSGGLTDGSGACTMIVRSREGFSRDGMLVSVTLEPSGTVLTASLG